MPQESTQGSAAIASGTAAGWTVASTFGNVGVAVGGTAFGVGALPVMGAGTLAGAVTGAAVYGAYRGLSEGDPLAFGSLGLGAAAGAGVSASVGGIGVVGGFGGVGLGIGAMTMMGGVAGLGLYGVAKMLDSPKESAFSAFSRMEERINEDLAYSTAYTSALIELTFPEDDILRTILEYEVDEDLARLRQEIQQVDPQAWIRAEQTIQMLPSSGSPPSSSVNLVKVYELQHHSADINALVFHPNQTQLLSASSDQTISCVGITTGKRQYCWNSPDSTLSMAVNPHNNTLLSGGEATNLTNWNLETGQLTEMLDPAPRSRQNNHFIHSICAGAKGQLFASAGADQVVTLWCKHEFNKLRYRPLRWLKGHTDTIFSIALSADERYLASGSADATIRVWDLELMWSEPKILTGHQGAIYAIVVCPTYPLLVSAGQDGTLRLWDLTTGQLLKTIQAHSQAIRFLAFSPNGSLLVSSGNDNATRLWSVVDQEIAGESRNLRLECQAMLTGCGPAAFNQAGNILATGDRTGKITLWRAIQS